MLMLVVPPVLLLVPALLLARSPRAEPADALVPPSAWEASFFSRMADGSVAAVLAVCVMAPLLEEMLFRGIVLRGFLQRYSRWQAIFMSALLFGAAHMNIYQFVVGFVMGTVLAWLYERTRSLIPCIALHAAYNTTTLLLADRLDDAVALAPAVGRGCWRWWLAVCGVLALRAMLVPRAGAAASRPDVPRFDRRSAPRRAAEQLPLRLQATATACAAAAAHRPLLAIDDEVPARHMVQRAQFVVAVEVPASVGEHARVGLRGDHLAQEQVVALLDVRLGQQPAFEPRRAAFEQRRIGGRAREGLQPVGRELVVPRGALRSRGPSCCPAPRSGRAARAWAPAARSCRRLRAARASRCSCRAPRPPSAASKSSGMAQAAAMMLRWPPCAALTSTVGPWFMQAVGLLERNGLAVRGVVHGGPSGFGRPRNRSALPLPLPFTSA
jgi:membrane protease YdiL (CAAX protease family)